jgi:hypothetical protein
MAQSKDPLLRLTVLFDLPQSEIASVLNHRIANAVRIEIVTGFITVEGIKVLENALRTNPRNLVVLVVGSGTYKAYEALDHLIGIGVPNGSLFVHLGHTRLTGPGATHRFYRYHPMLHSKIFYLENADKTACAFIGSHNVTGFALMGLNGEASIMIEGDIDHSEFNKIRAHIEHAKNQSVLYQSGMKEAYTWWANQAMEGIAQKANDIPRIMEKKQTVLLFCKCENKYPKEEDILYFELPEAIGKVQSLKAEIHVFIFDVLPSSPFEALSTLDAAKKTFWCKVEGLENNKGGRELAVDWYVQDQFMPKLKKAPIPFRPTPSPDMQQIRVKLLNKVYANFEYLFGPQSKNWLPILDYQQTVLYNESFSQEIEKLALIPAETNNWFLVKSLEPVDASNYIEDGPYQLALKSMEPDSGKFILFSTARRKK